MARKVTRLAFEKWIAEEENVLDVLTRIAGGLTLQKASVAVTQPYTCLHEYFHSSPEREARYLGARKAWADLKNDELVEKVENVKPDRDHVAKLKLESEVISNQSKAYHRERWGETLTVKKDVMIGVDAALLGRASELLRLAAERVLEPGQVIDAESPAARLPAPEAVK